MSNQRDVSWPRVTAVVPAHNEEETIGVLLDALALQTCPLYEVIVVDAGSRDRTRQEAVLRADRFRNFQIIEHEVVYPGGARNIGARAAKTEWLMFIDCGIRIEADCLERLIRETGKRGSDAVCGRIVPDTSSFFTECAGIAYVPSQIGNGEVTPMPSVALLLIWRALFETMGGFPEHLRSAEDLLFMKNLERHGTFVEVVPGVAVYWSLAPDLRSTYRRFRTYCYHNLKAGLFRNWQLRLGVYYGVTLLATATLLTSLRTPVVTLLPMGLFLGFRAARSVWKHREEFPAPLLRQMSRLLLITLILLVIDVATLEGVLLYVFGRREGQHGEWRLLGE